MKNLAIIIWILMPQLMLGQPYKSLFTEGKTTSWNIFSNTSPGSTQKYYANKDTIVDGESWKIFGRDNYKDGLVREDTINGKVWFKGFSISKYGLSDTLEKLVCNFSLNKGDSFHYYYNVPLVTVIISKDVWIKVDSVFYLDGLKHIQFDTIGCSDLIVRGRSFGSFEKFVMIEGVGTPWTFYYMFDIFNRSILQCQYRNEDLFYSSMFSPIPRNCNVWTTNSTIDNLAELSSSIYPNPNKGLFNIVFNDNQPKTVRLYDRLGSLVDAFSTEDRQTTLNLTHLAKGIYFINIRSAYRQSNSKIIIE